MNATIRISFALLAAACMVSCKHAALSGDGQLSVDKEVGRIDRITSAASAASDSMPGARIYSAPFCLKFNIAWGNSNDERRVGKSVL